MSTRNQTNNPSSKKDNRRTPEGKQFVEARVVDCIRDSDHPYYTGPDSLGTIFYDKVRFRNSNKGNLDRLNRAKPLFTFIKRYPIKNEIVLILNTTGRNIYRKTKGDGSFVKTYYLCEVNVWNSSHHNALPASEDISGSPNNAGEATVGIQQNTSTTTTQRGEVGPTKIVNEKITQKDDGMYTATIILESLTTGDQATGVGESLNERIATSKARLQAENQLKTPTTSQNTSKNETTGDFVENENSSELVAFDHTVIQDRQGAAIRLGSSTANGKNNWSNNESEGEPIVIISNGVADSESTTQVQVESINNLNTAVVQLSNQNIDDLTVSSTNVDSVGVTYESPSGENVIIEDIPPPPIEGEEIVTDAELEETFQSTPDSDVVEETVQKDSPPEIDEVGVYDDPIFALLDEAQLEGELTFVETDYDVAGTEATEGEEDNFGNIVPTNDAAADYPNSNDAAVSSPGARAVVNRQPVLLVNKNGAQHITPPPDPGLTMKRTSRTIKYIFVHTSAGNQDRIPSDTMNFFFRPNISKDGTKGGPKSEGGDGNYYGRFWEFGGYHWMIEKTGGLATRLYPDSQVTNGAGKADVNKDPNHINPINGEIEPLT